MKMMKSLLLGSAAGLVAIAGAQAADIPVKAKPVEYVKVCTAYGAGFYYIPGTDICIKVGGYIYMEAGWNGRNAGNLGYSGNIGNDLIIDRDDNLWNVRASGQLIMDARQQSAYGTIRSYIRLGGSYSNALAGGQYLAPAAAFSIEAGFIQFAGFTVGQATSFWDFGAFYSVLALSSIPWNWNPVIAYTANFGNGFSGTISLEDPSAYRTKIAQGGTPVFTGVATTSNNYGGAIAPDVIGNLRVDQAWGSAQIAGALHQVRTKQNPTYYTGTIVGQDDKWGYAVMGGIEIKTPMIAPGDSIMLQGVWSQGAVEYTGISASPLTTASGLGLKSPANIGPAIDLWDAVQSCGVAPAAGAACPLVLTTAWSANLMFRHYWQPNLRSAFWIGYNRVDLANAGLVASSPGLKMTQAGGNIIWSPNPTLDLSLDVLWTRMETDGLSATCTTVNFCGQTADLWTIWSRWRRNF